MRNKIMLIISICVLASCASQRGTTDRRTNLILSYAKSFLDTPYKYGGLSRKGIDCSGLIYLAYNQAGIKVARTAKDQSQAGKSVKFKNLREGDLVFFKLEKDGKKWWHAGIVSEVNRDDVKFIHASASRGVIESDLTNDYYWKNIKAMRRVL